MNKLLLGVVCLCIVGCGKGDTTYFEDELTERAVDEVTNNFYSKYYVENTLGIELEVDAGVEINHLVDFYQESDKLEQFRIDSIWPCWSCALKPNATVKDFVIPMYSISEAECEFLLSVRILEGESSSILYSKGFSARASDLYNDDYSIRIERLFDHFNGLVGLHGSLLSPRSGGRILDCGEDCPNGYPKLHPNRPNVILLCSHEYDCGGNGSGNDEPSPHQDPSLTQWTLGGGSYFSVKGWPSDDENWTAKWYEECSSYNGSIDYDTNDGGETVIDPEKGIIAINKPEDLYRQQIQSFINNNGLSTSVDDIINSVGTDCAVSYRQDVEDCLACKMISQYNYDGRLSYEILDKFDCIMTTPGFMDKIEEYVNSDFINPCHPERSAEETATNVLANMGEDCSLDAFEAAIDGVDKIIPTQAFEDCPNLKCVYDYLDDNNFFSYCNNILAFDNSDHLDLTLNVGSTEWNADAQVTLAANDQGGVVMTFAPFNCNESDHIHLAETILHESYHARFRYDLANNNISESQYRDSFMDWVNEEYGQNFTEHELMIQFYMNKIANELAILDGGRYDASYYMAWVWEGLEQYWPDYFDSATELDWETKRSTVRANNPWTCGG